MLHLATTAVRTINVARVQASVIFKLVYMSNPYGKRVSATITARMTNDQIQQVQLAATAHGCTVGEFTRRALARLTAGSDPAGVADDMKSALGLPAEATTEELVAALSDFVDELLALDEEPSDPKPKEPSDPKPKGPKQTPPADPSPLDDAGEPKPKALSAQQICALAKRGLPATQEAWTKLANSMVRRVGSEPRPRTTSTVVSLSKPEIDSQVAKLDPQLLPQIKARGMTPEDFVERRANVTRRT